MIALKASRLHPEVVGALRMEFRIRSVVALSSLTAPAEAVRVTVKMLRDQRKVHLWAPYKNKMSTWSVRPRCECPPLDHQPGCFWHLDTVKENP